MQDNHSKPKVGLLRRLRGWFYFLTLIALISGVVMWLRQSPYFTITQVPVYGELQYVHTPALQHIANQYIEHNIFQVDLNKAQTQFAAVPWIANVQVRRRLPNSLEIHLIERKPIAYWGTGKMVDNEGRVFVTDSQLNLPIFEGPNGTEREMVERLAIFQHELAKQDLSVAKLIYTPRSAWSIVLNNGVVVHLGREQTRERLARFVGLWPTLLNKEADNISYVDMRYKDGFVIMPRNYTPPPTAASDVSAATE